MTLGPNARRLFDHLLAGADDSRLAADLERWLLDRGYRTFADANRDKIRKKVRSATDADSRLDVRTELAVAAALLADRALSLAFEPGGHVAGGPDFGVTHRGGRAFNLEVTRLRRDPATVTDGGPLLAKLRQLPPSVPNVLLVVVGGLNAAALDVAGAVHVLRAADDAYFTARGLEGRRAFKERFRRVGAVLTWAEAGAGEARASVWVNPDARIAVPERALRACLAALRAPRSPRASGS